jgi:hypothetical protein
MLARKACVSPTYCLIGSVVISAMLGYMAFWIYLGNKSAGQVFSYGLTASSLAVLIAVLRQRPLTLLNTAFVVPLAYTLCLALFYLSLLYLFVDPLAAGVDVANVRFFPETRPGDNIIPFIFAQRVYDRAPVHPFCCGDWLSSDRPPLQAGIFLLQRPLRIAGSTGLQYQVLGTLMQCLWVCGVWTFLRTLRVSARAITRVLGLLAFSGFLFYNSVYAWPKLLAASFLFFVFALLLGPLLQRRPLRETELVLASLSFALALLAHPGSVFSAPAIIVVLTVRRSLITWKQASLATLVVAVLIVPWTLYQKLYDPPGDRLVKMHLAGVMQPDPRSLLQAIKDSYGRLSAEQIIQYKWDNLKTLAGRHPFELRDGTMQIAEREYIWNAIGILNIGWIMAGVEWIRRRRKVQLPYAGMMLCAALLNLLGWCLVMFGPGQTFTEHGSYADILLVSIGLLGFILELPPIALLLLLTAQALNLILVWLRFEPASFTLPSRAVVSPVLQPPMLGLALVLGLAGLLLFGRSYFERRSASSFADPLLE